MAGPLHRLRTGMGQIGAALRPGSTPPGFAGAEAPSPDRPAHVVGDLHGCHDLLDRLLDRINEDCAAQDWPVADLVFVGDYIDRGPDSAAVLERLRALHSATPDRIHCLRGNHEAMMLAFLETPEKHGTVWLANGGRETLQSFGITVPVRLSAPDAFAALADRARAALPADLLQWIADRPLIWQSGDVVAVHAALDPALPPADQSDATCLWGHRAFPRQPRSDGLWVVHGHRITVPPVASTGQISVDTGGFARGELSCAALAPGAPVRFLSVGPA